MEPKKEKETKSTLKEKKNIYIYMKKKETKVVSLGLMVADYSVLK